MPLRAHVVVLNGYSAHGDRTELQRWLDAVRAGNPGNAAPAVYLVHGEPDAQDAFAEQLRGADYGAVSAPTPHTRITL
jgi:metallo-beta-lactamase family protein